MTNITFVDMAVDPKSGDKQDMKKVASKGVINIEFALDEPISKKGSQPGSPTRALGKAESLTPSIINIATPLGSSNRIEIPVGYQHLNKQFSPKQIKKLHNHLKSKLFHKQHMLHQNEDLFAVQFEGRIGGL